MKRFKHINAESLEQVTSILKEYQGKAKVIAGGADLLGELKDDILPEYPEAIVNLKTLKGLDYIQEKKGALKIGALTRLEDIAKSETVQKDFKILADAAGVTASPHIREMGTIAGNICQSNRCWYYWVADNRFNCLRKGGKICYALTGDGRYHSIFGSTRVNLTPCTQRCPDNVDIPSYMSKIRIGNIAEAARILMRNNPIPAITGRICPHLCESECNRDYLDEAVSIRCVERYLGDYILDNSAEMYQAPATEIDKEVAVIGAGPAGLSAAYFLRRFGYKVTIFENMEEPGGLLTYGIPPYRLPKDVVKKQVKALEAMGIKLKLSAGVGSDIKIDKLAESYAALFIASGAWKERPSGIKGDELLLSGVKFLRKSNVGTAQVPGKKVAVIGGGNVAIDVARTLLRMGSEPVIIYRRGKDEMPALKDGVDKTEEEGIEIQFLTLPVEAARSGSKIALKSQRMKLGTPDESGRPRPIPVKGSAFIVEYDAVITAIGETNDYSIISKDYMDAKGHLKINSNTYCIDKNLFAGGDFVTGPATVVAAIAAGRKTADSINSYLGGAQAETEDKPCYDYEIQPNRFNSACLKITSRANAPELGVEARLKGIYIEESGGLERETFKQEANRCFNCGCVAVNPSDIAPALIALNAVIVTTKREIKAENFFTAGVNSSTVLKDDEVVKEIEVPAIKPGTKSIFTKFALRKSIDFPIVNCAAVIEVESGIVKSARICLNSVYNQPYRVTKAEQYITGKSINESTAEDASKTMIPDTLELVNNHYKIQIAKTLVKRAIIACNS